MLNLLFRLFLYLIIIISIIASLGVSIFILYTGYINLDSENKKNALGFASFIGTAFVSILMLVSSKMYEVKNHAKLELIKNKTEAYKSTISYLFELLKYFKNDKSEEQLNKLVDLIFENYKNTTIWGSDMVVSSFISFRKAYDSRNENLIHESIGNLILSIRKDIGHKNLNLNSKRVLRIFSDIK